MPDLRDELKSVAYPMPVVMDAAWANGLGVIRSLGKAGLKAIALSPARNSVGGASRYAIDLRCPNPASDPEELVRFLLDIGKELPHKGVLMVTDDTFLTVVTDARGRLEEHYHFPFPTAETLFSVMDKVRQHETALACGVPTPRTVFLHDESDVSNWPSWAFPAVVKGRRGKAFQQASGRQVLVVHHQDELRRLYRCFGQYGLILQEVIPGGDDHLYTLGTYMAPGGTVLGAFTGRKLRQTPPGFGICRMGESLACPTIREQGLKLLGALGFHGVSQVEFKLDPRDGSYKLIEINARFWMWHSLATYCGVNLAHSAYQDALGDAPEPSLSQRYGPNWILLADDLLHIPDDIRKGRLSFKGWIGTLRPPVVDGIIDASDPRPMLTMFERQARQIHSRRRQAARDCQVRTAAVR